MLTFISVDIDIYYTVAAVQPMKIWQGESEMSLGVLELDAPLRLNSRFLFYDFGPHIINLPQCMYVC